MDSMHHANGEGAGSSYTISLVMHKKQLCTSISDHCGSFRTLTDFTLFFLLQKNFLPPDCIRLEDMAP